MTLGKAEDKQYEQHSVYFMLVNDSLMYSLVLLFLRDNYLLKKADNYCPLSMCTPYPSCAVR